MGEVMPSSQNARSVGAGEHLLHSRDELASHCRETAALPAAVRQDGRWRLLWAVRARPDLPHLKVTTYLPAPAGRLEVWS